MPTNRVIKHFDVIEHVLGNLYGEQKNKQRYKGKGASVSLPLYKPHSVHPAILFWLRGLFGMSGVICYVATPVSCNLGT